MGKRILISGCDTGIGKTWVCRALVNDAAQRQLGSLSVIKPVETGIVDQPQDAPFAASGLAKATTLCAFPEAIAPLDAASAAGQRLDFSELVAKTQAAATCAWNLIEGAGGLTVPLSNDGKDWLDFALAVPVDELLLVVPNRLGAIHQGRVLAYYVTQRAPQLKAGFVLNQMAAQPESVLQSNAQAFASMSLPLVGEVTPAHGFSWLRLDYRCIDVCLGDTA